MGSAEEGRLVRREQGEVIFFFFFLTPANQRKIDLPEPIITSLALNSKAEFRPFIKETLCISSYHNYQDQLKRLKTWEKSPLGH